MSIRDRIADLMTGREEDIEPIEDQDDYLERLGVTNSRPPASNNPDVHPSFANLESMREAQIDIQSRIEQSRIEQSRMASSQYESYFDRSYPRDISFDREVVTWPRTGETTILNPRRSPRRDSPFYEASLDASKSLSERTKVAIIDSVLRDCYEMVIRAMDNYRGDGREMFLAMELLADTYLEEMSQYIKMRHRVEAINSHATFSRFLHLYVEMPGNPGVAREMRIDLEPSARSHIMRGR